MSKWGSWLVASYLSCIPVQLMSAAIHLSFDNRQVHEHLQLQETLQDVEEESVQLRRNIARRSPALGTPEAVIEPERTSQVEVIQILLCNKINDGPTL